MSAFGQEPARNFEFLLETFWSFADAQVKAGNSTIVIPDNIPEPLLGEISNRLSIKLGKDIVVERNQSTKVVSFQAVEQQPKKEKIPRPANAFILYRKANHDEVKAQHPGTANNDICKSFRMRNVVTVANVFEAKLIAAKWKKEPADVKMHWKLKSDQAKVEHSLKHPGYTYQPRKSSQLKRRMTKKKLAQLKSAHEDVDTTFDSDLSASSESISGEEYTSPQELQLTPSTLTPAMNSNEFFGSNETNNIINGPVTSAGFNSMSAVDNSALMQTAMQHSDEFFQFEDFNSANDLDVDYDEANFNRQFELPTTNGQLERLEIDISAFNDVYGIEPSGTRAVIGTTLGQAVSDEADNDMDLLATFLNLENTAPAEPMSSSAQNSMSTSVAHTHLGTPTTNMPNFDQDFMNTFNIPMRQSQNQIAAQATLESHRLSAARRRLKNFDEEYLGNR